MAKKAIDITGQKFGMLTALKQVESTPGANSSRWLCRCDCGVEKISTSADLRSGHSSQCGCKTGRSNQSKGKIVKHGLSKVPGYTSWSHMMVRCYSKKCNRYYRYGGRGIVVCARWRDDFKNFLDDMGKRPGPEYSLDRIDNDKNYSCGHCEECKANGWLANCRWATASEQSFNQDKSNRSNGKIARYIVLDGKKMTIPEASMLTGISKTTLYKRTR